MAADKANRHESHGLDPAVLIGVAIMLLIAKSGGEMFERLRQPAFWASSVAGICWESRDLWFYGAESLKTNETIAALAELGVIILCLKSGSSRICER
jgi:Kef-type K+ transport system membrane component KefB